MKVNKQKLYFEGHNRDKDQVLITKCVSIEEEWGQNQVMRSRCVSIVAESGQK